MSATYEYEYVRCIGCGHTWDDLNPDDYACACILEHGKRTVEIISAGVSNPPPTIELNA